MPKLCCVANPCRAAPVPDPEAGPADRLLDAALVGDIAAVEAALAEGALLDVQDEGDGPSALMYASAEGHEALVLWLLDRGADHAAQDREDDLPHVQDARAALRAALRPLL